MSTQLLKIKCAIERGAFSGERIVTVKLTPEQRVVAPVHYCSTADGEPLTELMPPPNQILQGIVQVPVTQVAGAAIISLPDGEMLRVGTETLQSLQA